MNEPRRDLPSEADTASILLKTRVVETPVELLGHYSTAEGKTDGHILFHREGTSP